VSQLLGMKIRSSRGFTAIELIIVLVIISVLSALALPSYLQWRQSLEARETASDFVHLLRKAKSDAINTNLEQEVQFNVATQQYGKRQGNQAFNATFPAMTAADWTSIKREVSFTPSVNIQFYPNGTSTYSIATSASITVQNSGGTRTFIVSVSNSGFITMH
jgi:prepilin-type N-terminal cleavage/methylation domain-containing protein